MAVTLVLDKSYALVLAGCIASGITLQFIGFGVVGGARKAAGLKYPAMYFDRKEAEEDPEKKKFNCAQRGHQNLLETYPTQLFQFLVGGLKFPRITTLAAIAWCFGAYGYAKGYATGNPDNRYSGLGGLIRLTSFVTLATSIIATLSVGGVLKSRKIATSNI